MKTGRLLFTSALALGLTLAVLAGLGGSLPHAHADTYTVTNTDAAGPGSLRQAILDTNGNAGHDTINFGIRGAIVLTGALPAIGDNLTITGPGVEQLSISGANTYRVFSITTGVAVTITKVTVRDGSAANGGGIYNNGTLLLQDMRVVGNSATNDGGGVYVNQGSATLNSIQIVNNSATNNGGGVYVYDGSATLNRTQVVNNSAAYGGGLFVSQNTVSTPGTIIVEKQTDPDGAPQSFEFSTSYGPNFSLADDETNNSGPLAPGVYSVSEVNIPSGWSLTSATCDDGSDPSAIALAPGETVVCTFENEQTVIIPGTIIVEKQTDPDGAPQS
ncbi:MAG: hypothetical protein GY832_38665, partial [Chloroflexi bacterium]|nr:hypothetical protein [Chloroflexota bacterium]